jgi:hypothetical protein
LVRYLANPTDILLIIAYHPTHVDLLFGATFMCGFVVSKVAETKEQHY